MRSYIISANYRDRSNVEARWLVRRADQSPEEAQAVSEVRAKGVIFCPSTGYEEGFGCTVVAFADEVEFEPSNAERVNLRFRGPGYNDFVDGNGKTHLEVAELYLGSDGSIQCVPMTE